MKVRFFISLLGAGFVWASTLVGATAEVAALRTLDAATYDGAAELTIASRIRAADDAARKTLAQELVAVVTDASATPAGRLLACTLLRLCATSDSVSPLAPLLLDPEFAAAVRIVVAGIPGAAADRALLAVLGRSSGAVRLGLIESLARRRVAEAFTPLAALAGSDDEATAVASLHALGALARDARDVNEIAALTVRGTPAALEAQQAAFFSAIAALQARGVNLDAVVVPFPRMEARTAAIGDLATGVMLRMNPDQLVRQIIGMLQLDDRRFRARAATALALADDATTRAALLAQADALDDDARALLLGGLAAHNAREVLALARTAAGSTHAALRLAGIHALGRAGEASDVGVLLRAAEEDDPVGAVARHALARLPDPKADALLLAEFARADSAVRTVLPDILVERGSPGAVDALLAVGTAAEGRLANECYQAAGRLANAGTVPALLTQWNAASDAGGVRARISRAIVAIGRNEPSGTVSRLLIAALPKAEARARKEIVSMLGGVADEAALRHIVGLARAEPPDEAALQAVFGWSGADALPELRALIEGGRLTEADRVSAWKGMLRLARPRLRDDLEDGLVWMEACMQLATSVEQRREVVAAMTRPNDSAMVETLDRWAKNPEIATEAAAARDEMAGRMASQRDTL